MDDRLATHLAQAGSPVAAWSRDDDPDDAAWARRMLAEAVARLHRAGLTASPILLEGDPRRALVDEAERWGADSIFVGARGLSAVERFLLGSVSAAVASRAHCSVEVVRTRP
jgi:nucleotide-binding universal stress UspA family protein